jgi:competence CoiA-like predicted nuclease
MEKEILYRYAEDRTGKIIHISNATEEEKYTCPGCKQALIFKHGQIRQHHFAHKNHDRECTVEGYLPKTFKN